MKTALAYIGVILIWSTTPLAIKWSGQGPGFIFGAGARMLIGAVCIWLFLFLFRKTIPWHRKALKTYLAVALQVYGAMMAVYWAAQFIPSGWLSVIFGLSPFVTALIAAIWLSERSLTISKLFSYLLGLGGLAVIFSSALQLGVKAPQGIIGVLVAVFLQSAASVWVKKINAGIGGLAQVAGGLVFALPAYGLTWYFVDQGAWPVDFNERNLYSIIYLGAVATTIGFSLYYYILLHLSATSVAMLTLVSPVLALIIGHEINHEPVSFEVAAGATLILSALLIHSYFDRVFLKSSRTNREN